MLSRVALLSASSHASRDVILRTQDFDAAVHFYTSVLGFTTLSRTPSLVGVDGGAFTLYIERGPAHGPVFDFLVPDFAAAKVSLLTAGCALVEEDATVPRCYLRDPFGLVFNIAQQDPATSA